MNESVTRRGDNERLPMTGIPGDTGSDHLLGAHVSIAGGLHRAFGRAEELGCTVLQIFTKNASQWRVPPLTEKIVETFTEERKRSGIPVLAHDAYLINLASPDSSLRGKSVAAFVDEMERAEQLAIPFLVMHPGAHRESGEDSGVMNIIKSFNTIFKRTAGFRVQVLVENTAGQGTAVGHRFEQVKRIVEDTTAPERLGVCLDTCHAFAAGYDLRTASSYDRTMFHFDATVGMQRLKALHLNDCMKGLGLRVDRHAHIGCGMIGLECFRLIMNDPRLRKVPKIIETPKHLDGEEMDRVNLQLLRDLVCSKDLRDASAVSRDRTN